MNLPTLPPSNFSPIKPLRIAFLVPEDRRTGTWFRYHNLAIALQKIGHQITVYSQTSANRIRRSYEIRDGVPYLLSPTVPGNRFFIAPVNPANAARRFFEKIETADVYHLFQPFPSAALIWKHLRKRRKALFAYDWDDFWMSDELGLKNPRGLKNRWNALTIGQMERRLPALADLTTTVSHPLAELAKERNSRKTMVLHNGIWPTDRKSKQSARNHLNLQPDAFYIGLMGWSGKIEWCFEAVRKFSRKFPNLRLAITGMDRSEILERYPDIRNRIDLLGVLSDDDFAYFNSSLDLGLVPMSDDEFNHYRLPFKLTDHLSHGIPVLCTRIGDTALLADRLDGIFSSEPILESWLDVFQKTVEKLLSGDSTNLPSPQKLLKEFSWIRIAEQLSEAYLKQIRQLSFPFRKPETLQAE